jgi:hypothetical protein
MAEPNDIGLTPEGTLPEWEESPPTDGNADRITQTPRRLIPPRTPQQRLPYLCCRSKPIGKTRSGEGEPDETWKRPSKITSPLSPDSGKLR